MRAVFVGLRPCAVLNPPYWNVNIGAIKKKKGISKVLNPPYWNVNLYDYDITANDSWSLILHIGM